MRPGPYTVLAALLLMFTSLLSTVANATDGRVLPRTPQVFSGKLAPSTAESTQYHVPSQIKPPSGAPNVLLIMTDDVGFGAVSAFGGAVPKPNLDRLAKRGLRYNRFHTVGVCSPTRAALLTGRNHHSVGAGHLVEMASPYPGYVGMIPPSAATVARILRDNGYSTAMFGKDHNVPMEHRSPAGPFHQWPTGRGFEHFYGWVSGDTDQFSPSLYQGTQPLNGSQHGDDYIFDRDMVDRTIEWIHTQKAAVPGKPFFVYQALGTAHAPQQAPAEWIEKFRGRFDHGWDELERIGEADNTLVIYIEGDNGSAAETGIYGSVNELPDITRPETGLYYDMNWLANNLDVIGSSKTYAAIPAGWSFAMNTPLPWTKQVASHLGAVRNGLVICWPQKIKQGGELRSQFHHVIDVTPTILDAAGVTVPEVVDGVEQLPMDGTSMLYSFAAADAAERRTTQYFELFGNRAIYHDGWLANTRPPILPWDISRTGAGSDTSAYEWQLYDLRHDFSQSRNLAAQAPEQLREMQKLFDSEARKYNVYPLQNSGGRYRAAARNAQAGPPRTEFVYWGANIQVPHSNGSPPLFRMPFSGKINKVVVRLSGRKPGGTPSSSH